VTPVFEHPWVRYAALWHAAASAAAVMLFALDKYQARRGGDRVPEARLFLISLLGGWPGALLAMLLFRHKTAKGSFQLKLVAAVLLWSAVVAAAVALAWR
jgi:uncharacterized membrane protein YsdA (DUF1294 family)